MFDFELFEFYTSTLFNSIPFVLSNTANYVKFTGTPTITTRYSLFVKVSTLATMINNAYVFTLNVIDCSTLPFTLVAPVL